MPIILLPRLLLNLISLALLACGVWLLWTWWRGHDVIDASGRIAHHVHGPNWLLWTGAGLLVWSFGGGRLVVLALMKGGHSPATGRTASHEVLAPDGAKLHLEASGRSTGPTIILTHGWGLNSTAWGDLKQRLGSQFRVIAWDLPGLGRSGQPSDGGYAIERFAQALGAVVESAGDGPIVLVGHSIGGMTTQTFWRSASDVAKARIAGIVLVDTTHEDPCQTMWLSGLWRTLKAPLIEPLMHLTVWLSPLAWLSSWQGYLSGSSQLVMRLTGFGRHATRGQVDLTARLAAKGSPGVQAKGNLAMLRWRVTDILPSIAAPTLVLAGTRDIVTLPSASRTITKAIAGARLVEVEGCGHMGFMEAHDRYNSEIEAFALAVLRTPAVAA